MERYSRLNSTVQRSFETKVNNRQLKAKKTIGKFKTFNIEQSWSLQFQCPHDGDQGVGEYKQVFFKAF